MGSMKMFKFTRPLDEQGVSVVLGAILLLGIGIAVGSLVYSQYVQSTLHSTEANFMNDVGGKFVQLQSSITTMGAGQWTITNLKMNPSFPFFIPTQGEVGTLSANSGAASSFLSEISAKIWNNVGGSVGSASALNENDNQYWEANQVVFSEKFQNTVNWTEYTAHDDPGTLTPALDTGVSYPDDGTGSIHVEANPTKESTTLWENAYWQRDFMSPLSYDYPITLQAWFKSNFWTNKSGASGSAAWQIDVEHGATTYLIQTLYAHQETTTINGTPYKSLENYGADATGTTLSASVGDNRQLWGKAVYSLQGISAISANSTWTFNYRSWLSSVPPIKSYYSPSLTSGSWTNPNGAYDNDNNNGYGYASVISDNSGNNPPSTTENYHGYNLNIPTGSTINGVRVGYQAWTAGLTTYYSTTLYPNASGDETNLYPLPAVDNNWQAVNFFDNDNSYVYWNKNSTRTDLYNLTDNTQTGTIDNVVVFAMVRGSSTSGLASTRIKTGGSTFNGSNYNVTTSLYENISTTYLTNPAGGNWTWDNVNSLQAGVQLNNPTNSDNTRCTYVYVVVNYHQTQPTNDNLRIYVSGNGGQSWSSPQNNSLPSSETTNWDNFTTALGWTPANLNGDNFWVKVDAITAGAAGKVCLDWVPVEVTYTLPDAVAQASVDILVRHDNGTINDNIASDVAISNNNLTENPTTLAGTYKLPVTYTVENNRDYLEIDYYVDVVSAANGQNAYLRIDDSSLSQDNQTRVTNVTIGYGNAYWTPGVVKYENSYTDLATMNWTENSSSPIIGQIESIRAWMYAYANSATASGSQSKTDAWTDYISLLAGPPFVDNVLIGSKQITAPHYVTSVTLNIGFLSKDSGSMVDLYLLENNGTDNWLVNPNPVLLQEQDVTAEGRVDWTIPLPGIPDNYIDNNGVIWLNLVAENDNSPFRLLFDYVKFQLTYVPGYEQEAFIQGYYGSSGALTFQMNLYSFPNQSYIYDDGAVILYQDNSSIMVSPPTPPLVQVINVPDSDKIRVNFNHVALTGVSPPPITKTGYASISVYLENSYYTYSNPLDNQIVTLKIKKSPLTAGAWADYLSKLANSLNVQSENNFFYAKGFLAYFDPGVGDNYLYFTVTDTSGNSNIEWNEHVTQCDFSLS
jgi:hypothetical protein